MPDSAIPWTAAHQASLSITNSRSLLKLRSIKSMMPFNHLIVCHPLPLPPSIFPSIRVYSNEAAPPIRWPKYWSFSFTISPSNEHPGLISFRMDWLDFLAVQRTLKSLLQHHTSKASILQHSALFSPALTSIHDHWRNHSFDQMDLCWPSTVILLGLHVVGRGWSPGPPQSCSLVLSLVPCRPSWYWSPSV